MKKIKLWLVIAASAMLLSACGQDQDDTGSPIILDGEPISTEAAPGSIMKKIKLWLVIAASAMLLSACGQDQDDTGSPIILDGEPISTEAAPSTEAANQETAAPGASEDDTLPPREGMVRSRLTNEWVDEEVANTRPIAVMTPNEISAIPHYNLSNASILYEANVEGRMTRMLALYEDWEKLEKIGNIRSLRTYYAYWSFEWDAILLHFGGPFFVDELLAQPNTQNLNGNSGGADSNAFFRSTDRKAPHNAYATGEGIKKAAEAKGYSLSYRGLADEKHYQFTSKAEPNTLEQYGPRGTAFPTAVLPMKNIISLPPKRNPIL